MAEEEERKRHKERCNQADFRCQRIEDPPGIARPDPQASHPQELPGQQVECTHLVQRRLITMGKPDASAMRPKPRPVKKAERKMNPSASETNPSCWFVTAWACVGRCASVINTSIKPRRASNSGWRWDLRGCNCAVL